MPHFSYPISATLTPVHPALPTRSFYLLRPCDDDDDDDGILLSAITFEYICCRPLAGKAHTHNNLSST